MKNSQNHLQELTPIHPIFQIPQTRVLWYDQVKKINSHSNYQKRFFAVTNIGLFLLEQKIFPKSIVISRFIPIHSIKMIKLNSEYVVFGNKENKKKMFALKSPEHLKFTHIIYVTLKTLLNENDFNKIEIEIDIEVKKSFFDLSYIYKTESILADRFLGNIFDNFELGKLNGLENILDIISKLIETKNEFTFTSDLVTSNFISSIVYALQIDTNVNHLTLKVLNICSFCHNFINIIQNNSISKLTLNNVVVVGNLDYLKNTFTGIVKSSLSDLIFENCELVTDGFLILMKFFQDPNSHIQHINFNKCSFLENIFRELLELIDGQTCFKSLTWLKLENIQVDNIQEHILNFLESPAIENMKKLFLIKNNLESSLIIEKVMEKSNSIVKLNLSYNNFTRQLNFIRSFCTLEILILSSCKFTAESFVSLMKSLSLAQYSPQKIVMNSISIPEEDLDIVYNCLSSIILPNLCHFSWSKNLMKPTQTEKFCTFLTNNPNIVEIDISNSISNFKLSDSLKYLLKYIKQCSLEKFILRGSAPTMYETNLYPILEALSEIKTLKYLDISGQKIHDKGIQYLFDIIKNVLVEFYYDGLGLTNIESFSNLIHFILDSKITKTCWPSNDEKNILIHTDPYLKNNINTTFDKLRAEFYKKFKFNIISPKTKTRSYSEKKTTPFREKGYGYKNRRTSLFRQQNPKLPFVSTPNIPKLQCENDLRYREDDIKSTFYECLGTTEKDMCDDVLVKKFYELFE